jgi:hypothetical protein
MNFGGYANGRPKNATVFGLAMASRLARDPIGGRDGDEGRPRRIG